jgi:hypothetical protein
MTSKDFRLGNFVTLTDNPDDITVIIGLACSKLGYETFTTLNLNKELREGPIGLIKPIPLTEDWFPVFVFTKEQTGKFSDDKFSHGINDYKLVFTRDWREEPSYHFGIEYTDSPFPEDEDKVYSFAHQFKFVHQLQNIFYITQHIDPYFNHDEFQKLIQKKTKI